MNDVFKMQLRDIQPSQLYISSEKLVSVMAAGHDKPLEPVPIKRLSGRVIYTDGHTRALVAHLTGCSEISVYWDKDELDWEAYQICMDWCVSEGITSISDLKDRVIPPEEYQILWLDRCRVMHDKLRVNSSENKSPEY